MHGGYTATVRCAILSHSDSLLWHAFWNSTARPPSITLLYPLIAGEGIIEFAVRT